ncbi:polysaccharide biosynthesis protein [Sinomonas mesophila]|uniref:polysaccharide biosynthesis protein n=1 Tax=Sinomonas mesophila TaxID=1531955 RepID=UPI00098728B6|nr:nucleoside-diphosphate sugar epimerase/dehydratase [Sinomonas mesophila]
MTERATTPEAPRPVLWRWIQFLLDAGAWTLAILMAVVLRYELTEQTMTPSGVAVFSLLAIGSQALVGFSMALYQGRHSFGSFEEARLLVAVTLIVATILVLLSTFLGFTLQIPRSTGVIAFPFAALFMAATRYAKRMVVESKAKPGANAQQALVYGAGFLGTNLVSRMMQDPASPYFPAGFVDDDPAKKHLRVSSVQVLGTGDDLPELVRRTHATVLILAFAAADASFIRGVSDHVAGLGVKVLVLPPLKDMLGGGSHSVTDFREVAVEDLIGRRPVDITVEDIAGYITGKRVLVTGAGGSIGSELCRQIHPFEPAELIMLDHDETALQQTQISLTGRGLLAGSDTVLASIRDGANLAAVFAERRPEVVFHAAALKHAPLLQQYPGEAWKTNVLGTLNVLRAAEAAGVEAFVNISTDKAASPTTVLGHSKRMAERLTAWMAGRTGRKYVSVRFGNVMGSRGSMLPLFSEQIRNGGPVTVTHPEVTRFFMTIPEACQLVIQAGAIGTGGEVLILDMGEPVRILDVARRMIAMSGRDIEIVYTGLRPAEKLHEDLVDPDVADVRPLHPKISHAAASGMPPEQLDYERWLAECERSEEAMFEAQVQEETELSHESLRGSGAA